MLSLLITALIILAAIWSYAAARRFVRERLRYVDGVQKWTAPVLAGLGAMLLVAPVVWLVPVLGAGTAVVMGVAVAAGVARGAREVRTALWYRARDSW